MIIEPKRVFRWLLAVSIGLVIVHTFSVVVADATGRGASGPMTGAVNLGIDSAIPTWLSAVILLAASVALLWVWADSRTADVENRRHWLVLAAIFCALSIDEVATLHERWSDLGLITVDNGLLYYGWVLTAGVMLFVFVVAYLPFLRRLDRRTAVLFIASGVIFVGGALGVEMLNASLDAEGQSGGLRYSLQTGFEEFCEFAGASLFLYAVLDVLATRKVRIVVAVEAATTADRPAELISPASDEATHDVA